MLIDHILNSPIAQIISPSISLTNFNELPLLVIRHKACQSVISLQGAQLLFWQPANTDSTVIWLSEKACFSKGKAIRGGVPICWPHFADFGEPLHGFARLLEWRLVSFKEQEQHIKLSLQLTNTDQTDFYINKDFNLQLDIELGLTCQMQLQISADNLEVTTALHSYFNISNISDVRLQGLGSRYQERFATANQSEKVGELTVNQMVDRIYTEPETINRIHDIHRIIQITQLNTTDVVVWNPWKEKSQTIVDMEDNGYETMVCVETGRITKPIHCRNNQQLTTLGFKIELITA